MNPSFDADLDLFAVEDPMAETLPETDAAGWSTGACLSSGGTAGGTFSSFGSLSSVN
jgi:hypothetical protein